MASQAQQPAYQHKAGDDSNRSFDWLDLDRRLSDDNLFAVAYALSEAAVTLVGPLFWACLVWLFLVAQF